MCGSERVANRRVCVCAATVQEYETGMTARLRDPIGARMQHAPAAIDSEQRGQG